MAASGERRMVFDIRGRRKHVVRVVYAILAVLMGASLFLVVGPFNLTGLLGTGGSTTSGASLLEAQASRIERRLGKSPNDPSLLLSLIRARISAGGALTEVSPTTGQRTLPPAAHDQLEKAAAAWARYLKQAPSHPDPAVARAVAEAFVTLASQPSTTGAEAEANIKAAARAQQIGAAVTPNLGTISTLATYEYFAFDFAGADRETRRARSLATSRLQRREVERQLAQTRRRAKTFQSQLKAAEKASKGTGKEALKNPFGGLGGASSTLP